MKISPQEGVLPLQILSRQRKCCQGKHLWMLVLSHNRSGVTLLFFEQPWTEVKNKFKLLNPLITPCHRAHREGMRLRALSVVEPDQKRFG